MRIEFRITEIKNLSNNLTLVSAKNPHCVEVVECHLTSIVLQTLGVVSAKGQLLSITGVIDFHPKALDFAVAGEITEYQAGPEKSAVIHFRYHQFNKTVWAKYIELLAERQNRINQIFKAVKGDNE
jgi:hypothetical protein